MCAELVGGGDEEPLELVEGRGSCFDGAAAGEGELADRLDGPARVFRGGGGGVAEVEPKTPRSVA